LAEQPGSRLEKIRLLKELAYTTPFEKYLKACQFSNDYLYDLIVDPRPIISKEDFV